jgi:FkbH-like protein
MTSSRASVLPRLLLVADSVLDPMIRLLADGSTGRPMAATSAPFGEVMPVLLSPEHPAWAARPDAAFVWTRPERVSPAFAELTAFKPFRLEEALEDVDRFADALLAAAERLPVFVASWVLPPWRRGLQATALRHESGVSNVLMRLNLRLAERVEGQRNVVLLDAAWWLATCEAPACDPKLEALAKVAWSRPLLQRAASELRAVWSGLRGGARKLVVCDLDNTLWGGIVGDDGLDGLRLGGHDPVGESHAALQRELAALAARGILLAICSKNDAKVATDAIRNHPEMRLRLEDFAAVRINWEDKAANMRSILNELNLLPGALVFLDDSPQERDRVRGELPEALVPELPADPSGYAALVASLDCFESGGVTKEDLDRAKLYREESLRRSELAAGDSMDGWLRTLRLRVTARRLDGSNLVRVAQLLNKTNQFNLTTRRLGEAELLEWSRASGRAVWSFDVEDRFGSAGLTGIASLEVGAGEGRVVDLVMSCRVMGRGVEDALLEVVRRAAKQLGVTRLTAPCVETPRNGPVRDFIARRYIDAESALLAVDTPLLPSHIELVESA